MSARSLLILLAMTICPLAQPVNAATASASGVAHKHGSASHAARTSSKKKRTYRVASARLVPPPPAYMPTILPELYYRQQVPSVQIEEDEDEAAEPAKPKVQYVQYFGHGSFTSTRAATASQSATGVINYR